MRIGPDAAVGVSVSANRIDNQRLAITVPAPPTAYLAKSETPIVGGGLRLGAIHLHGPNHDTVGLKKGRYGAVAR